MFDGGDRINKGDPQHVYTAPAVTNCDKVVQFISCKLNNFASQDLRVIEVRFLSKIYNLSVGNFPLVATERNNICLLTES